MLQSLRIKKEKYVRKIVHTYQGHLPTTATPDIDVTEEPVYTLNFHCFYFLIIMTYIYTFFKKMIRFWKCSAETSTAFCFHNKIKKCFFDFYGRCCFKLFYISTKINFQIIKNYK